MDDKQLKGDRAGKWGERLLSRAEHLAGITDRSMHWRILGYTLILVGALLLIVADYRGTGISLVIMGTILVGIGLRKVDGRGVMNVIAWEGFEGLAGSAMGNPPRLVEYVRGIEKVNRLAMHGRPFDVIIADAEQIQRLHKQEKFYAIKTHREFRNMFEAVAGTVRNLTETLDDTSEYALPLRWGMNDILVNHSVIKDSRGPAFLDNSTEQKCSWADFSLEKWIDGPDAMPIGLWDWYLPSLLSLSLARRSALGLQCYPRRHSAVSCASSRHQLQRRPRFLRERPEPLFPTRMRFSGGTGHNARQSHPMAPELAPWSCLYYRKIPPPADNPVTRPDHQQHFCSVHGVPSNKFRRQGNAPPVYQSRISIHGRR